MKKRKLSVALSVLLASGMLAPMNVVAAPHISPYGVVEAEFDFDRDVADEFTEDDGVTTAVSLETGNYFTVKDIEFSKGVSQIGVKLKADAPGVIVIKKDGKDGETIGNIKICLTACYTAVCFGA